MQSVTIRRGFRRTKKGCHFAAIVENGGLQFLDGHPQASYEGRRNGFETYSLAVPKGTLWLEFIKDDRTEMVLVRRAGNSTPIQGFSSFGLARRWVQRLSSQGPELVSSAAVEGDGQVGDQSALGGHFPEFRLSSAKRGTGGCRRPSAPTV